jgi:hypothetical protein
LVGLFETNWMAPPVALRPNKGSLRPAQHFDASQIENRKARQD